MADEKSRDWVDTVSKLLILTYCDFCRDRLVLESKRQSDAANQQFQRENEVLKLAASSNDAERTLGLKTIEILQKQGKFSKDMLPVVQAISQARPSDASTQRAQNMLEVAKLDPAVGNQIASAAKGQAPTIYIQVTRDEQRADVSELVGSLQSAGFEVPAMEFVNPGAQNNYVRYSSASDKPHAD